MKLDLTNYAPPKFNTPRRGSVLLAEHTEVAAEIHPDIIDKLDLTKISEASNHKLPWKCEQGHEWFAVIQKRAQKKTPCPECPSRRVKVGVNDLQTKYPTVAEEWHPTKNADLRPTDIAAASHEDVWWQCKAHGHEWRALVYNRTVGKTNCPVCSGNVTLEGFNDLATTHPEIAMQLKCVDKAKTITSGSSVKQLWVCSKGHEYETTPYNRSLGTGCTVCLGMEVLAGFNDVLTTHPELVESSWDYSKNSKLPSDVTYGSRELIQWKCAEHGHEWVAAVYSRTGGNYTGCPVCSGRMSKGERELTDFVKSEVDKVIENYRGVRSPETGGTIELDVYVPELKIGIEYNGLFYHSEYYQRDKHTHLVKRGAMEAAGIRLITVWEDDWKYRNEVVKQSLRVKLGTARGKRVYGRNVMIREIDSGKAFEFLERNHIQGAASGRYYLGAYESSELVAVMVLKVRKGSEYELVRYATSCQVVGGHSKMVTWAKNNTDVSRMVTFADLDISDGSLYEKTGWVLEEELPPDYKYLVSGRYRKHKFGYRKHKFKADPKLKYVEGYTEKQLAELNNMYRIWDSGKKRYSLELRK